MTSLDPNEQRQTPHHRRKDFVKVPMESLEVVLRELTILESSTTSGPIMMMDKLTISPTGSTPTHKERSVLEVQSQNDVQPDLVKVPMESLEAVLGELTILESSTMSGPIMMMDKLTISPTESTQTQKEKSEPEVESQNDVQPVSSYIYPTLDTPWMEYSGYCCEFCGHRSPHSLLKILHSRRHTPKFNNAKDRLRELYKKV